MPLFSVIVSIYNVAGYFDSGLTCLLNQDFKDFEIILVDDGSTDGSGRLCDEAEAAYPSLIKVIHQPNSGLGGARNRGIDEAKGTYICFFDIDDAVPTHWLQCIKSHTERSRPQILIYGYTETNFRYGTTNSYAFKPFECHSNEDLRNIYAEHLSGIRFNNGFAWNKVYERAFLTDNTCRFPNLRIQQDEVFNLNVYPKAERVSIVSEVLYDYRIYYRGNTRSRYITDRIQIFSEVKRAFFHLFKQWDLNDKELETYVHRRFLNNIIYNVAGDTLEQRRAYLQQIFDSREVEDSIHFLKTRTNDKHHIFFRNYLKAFEQKSLYRYTLTRFTESVIDVLKGIAHHIKRVLKMRHLHSSKN